MKDGVILGIETSCDETSAAVVSGGRVCHSNIVASQAELHKLYGGVVPEIASRRHVELIAAVVDEALAEAGVSLKEVSAIAVTNGPGLVGALLVGVSYAKGLAYSLGKPLIAVDHIRAHMCSTYVDNEDWNPPFICLVVSGGHTMIAHVRDTNKYDIIGQTLDDAAGEAFDKVARTLGMGYPGGPILERTALLGDREAISFPRALPNSLDFSFSGLKSSVVNFLAKHRGGLDKILEEEMRRNVAASFQAAVVDVLVEKSVVACLNTGVYKLAVVGGVASSGALRRAVGASCNTHGIELNIPTPKLCTDNAAMVAAAAYEDYMSRNFAGVCLNAYAGISK